MDSDAREWFDIADAEEIVEGEVRTYLVGSEKVAVARAEGALYAVQDLCSHDNGPLGEGSLVGFEVQSPRHGAKFDVRDGRVTSAPALMAIGTFEVRELNGRVQVAAPPLTDDDW